MQNCNLKANRYLEKLPSLTIKIAEQAANLIASMKNTPTVVMNVSSAFLSRVALAIKGML